MDEIESMSHPQRIATMAVITSIEDPKFDMDNWLQREQFFDGYAQELVAYKKRKMGYKTPSKKDIAERIASVGIPLNKAIDLAKKEVDRPVEIQIEEPIIKAESKPHLTPVRGVQRVPPSAITDYFNQNQ